MGLQLTFGARKVVTENTKVKAKTKTNKQKVSSQYLRLPSYVLFDNAVAKICVVDKILHETSGNRVKFDILQWQNH